MALYRGPIIDAHHHFWEPELGHQPWLRPDAHIPFRYGDYEAIKHSYLPPDLLRDADGLAIAGTVTMETEWELDDPLGEMAYMEAMQEKYGLPSACVAHALLNASDVDDTLAALADKPIVRSVRHKPGQASCAREAPTHPTLMMNARWRAGFALLEKYSLHFDLQVPWYHVDEILDLGRSFPNQLIIINHAALPADRSAAGLRGWADAVARMAQLDNTVMKISGIGVPGVAWTAENNRFIVETIMENFGSERIMFASNFPVDSLTGSYREIFDGFRAIAAEWSDDEQRDAFARTAVRVYGLDEALLSAADELSKNNCSSS
ncbi:MAG: amidohydrolase family protein [Actinomycetaceae bacterium]|nr:amidohydrolase family protein [Arcanobacterium sp.]MDD7686382.1 amidohydrolase family protein [Actinomycetaceae bacterium]MDY5272662.1 amidohydrolase family protein [Arcanobacterium sp.]